VSRCEVRVSHRGADEAGDDFIVEGIIRYPDRSLYNFVGMSELDRGRIVRETWYFASPFDHER
jgi:hypothetical protein